MADEFNSGTTNWWDSARSSTTSSSSSMNNNSGSLVGSFGWPTDIADIKARSSISIDSSASNSVSAGSPSVVFQDHSQTKLQHQQQQQGHDSGHDFHMMGLGLSSPSLDWNQALLRGDKTEPSFRSMLQDNLNSSNNTNYQHHQQDHQWRPDHQQQHHHHSSLNRGFSLDPHHHHNYGLSSSDSTVTCQGLPTSFHHHMDSSPANLYGAGSPSNILQGLLLGTPDHNNNNSSNNQYGVNTVNHDLLSSSSSSWSKVPQFLRSTTSPPKQQLHFSNNAPFWNASAAAAMSNDVRSNSGFFPSLQTPPYPTPTFEEKPKHNISEVRESSTTVTKKSEPTSKRTRNETSSNLPAFKVRKEKMGDRITALQQLVSPFGKTDTASVLSEAIAYIKFLHEQVTVLSTPYMKSGAPIQHHQNSDKSKDNDGPKQDLRSRGLCLVPVSSTFPVTHHEATVDFWTPTFGGTFR